MSDGGRRSMHKVLRLPSVIDRTGLSRSTIYTRVREGTFPRQIPLGPNAVGWLQEEVEGWIDNCVSSVSKVESRKTLDEGRRA